MDTLGGFILLILMIALYFVPTIVAWIRSNHVAAIFVLNLFLGWTGVVWIIALVMALWNDQSNGEVATGPQPERESPVTSSWHAG